jgi:Raf kinase inhibitor-like YbhB/YbcL family protein
LTKETLPEMKYGGIVLAVALVILFSGCAQKPGESVKVNANGETMKNTSVFRINSPAYAEGGQYPEKYTCDGQEISPPLEFAGMPGGTKTLALVLDDPDAPGGTYDHWLMWNIPPVPRIEEDSVPPGAMQGVNSDGTNGYVSPCPPAGTHRYIYHAYALDTELDLSEKTGKADLEKAMKGHVLAQATLTGLYRKK